MRLQSNISEKYDEPIDDIRIQSISKVNSPTDNEQPKLSVAIGTSIKEERRKKSANSKERGQKSWLDVLNVSTNKLFLDDRISASNYHHQNSFAISMHKIQHLFYYFYGIE